MITVNSDGNALSPDFAPAAAGPVVSYDMALVVDGERLPGELGRMTLSLGSSGDQGDSSAGLALGGVFSSSLAGTLFGCGGQLVDRDVEVRVGVDVGGSYEYVTVATVTVTWSRTAGDVTSIQAAGPVTAKMTGVPLGLDDGYVGASVLASAISLASGVDVGLGSFATTDQQVHVSAGWTCRRALEALAMALGGFAAEQGDGSVLVAPIPATRTYEADPDIVRAMPQLADSAYAVAGLVVSAPAHDGSGEVAGEWSFGTGSGLAVTDEWATAETAAALWANVSRTAFWPGSVTLAVLDPRITPFDMVRVALGGETYDIPALSIAATYDGGYFGTVSATAPSETASGAGMDAGPMAVAVGEARDAALVATAAAASATADAATAQAMAERAVEDAETAQAAAETAQGKADEATSAASEAAASALEANTYALGALAGLGTVEDVVDVLAWVSAHGSWQATADTAVTPGKQYWLADGEGGHYMADVPEWTYSPTADTEPAEDKVYYIRTGSGAEADPYVYFEVDDPQAADMASYYERAASDPSALGYLELDSSGSVTNYIASHLALLDDGLYITADGNSYRMRLSSSAMYIINPNGVEVGRYGEDFQVGPSDSLHLEGSSTRLAFTGPGGDVLWFGLSDGDDPTWEMHVQSLQVEDTLVFGGFAWIRRSNGNMTLKWVG